MTEIEEKKGFTIFRASDAPGLMEAGCMKMEPITQVQREGLNKLVEGGYLHGDEVTILVDMPGFSLAHAWLKRDYPLLLHSHDSDCLYYVVAGSLKLGTEELGPRDCFFVPSDTPYTYRPGPDGVEVLEFRHQPEFNFVNLSRNASFYAKALESVAENVEHWKVARRPSETV